MEIRIDENIPNGTVLFSPYGRVESFPGRNLTADDLKSTDVLIVRSVTRVNRDLLENTPVKFVGTATIGIDHVDYAYLESRRIGFASAPGCNSNSVGQYITAALLRFEQLSGRALDRQVIGLIGYGNVGKNVAAKAEALGMTVLKNDPPLKEKEPERDDLVDLKVIQAESDIITLHTPLTISGRYPTLGLVGRAFFRGLNKPIALINSGRGRVIDEQALMSAKKEGRITRLCLDVWPTEPAINPALCAMCDIATPHIAGYSLQGKQNGSLMVLKAMCRFFHLPIKPLENQASPEKPVIEYSGQPREFLLNCVAKAYAILDDDSRLKSSLLAENPGHEFDLLRKNYPVRHEFPLYSVQGLPESKAELGKKLAGLGFGITSSLGRSKVNGNATRLR